LTPETAEKLDAFFRVLRDGARPLLLLDYDGTLASFRVNRFDARPWAGVRELLGRIQEQGQTRMAVVTGRPGQSGFIRMGAESWRRLDQKLKRSLKSCAQCCGATAWAGSSRTSRMLP
jgi:hypothetical protein